MGDALVVYSTENSNSISYINEGCEFVKNQDFYVSSRYNNTIAYFENIGFDVVFILTNEHNSSHISKEQYEIFEYAISNNIPVFIIYKIKGGGNFYFYNVDATLIKKNTDKYGYLSNFKKILVSTVKNYVFDHRKTKEIIKKENNKSNSEKIQLICKTVENLLEKQDELLLLLIK